MVKICQMGLLKLNFEKIPKKRIFRVFAKNFRRPWMKLKKFFGQFPNPWALRVSGMGCYTSKCENKSKSLHPYVHARFSDKETKNIFLVSFSLFAFSSIHQSSTQSYGMTGHWRFPFSITSYELQKLLQLTLSHMASEVLFRIWQGGQPAITVRTTSAKVKTIPGVNYTLAMLCSIMYAPCCQTLIGNN